MKNVIIIFSLLFAGQVFASIVPEIHEANLKNKSNIIEKTNDDACRASCWGEVTNTETGVYRYFTSNATAGDCVTAQTICISRIMAQINEFMHAN